jgi:RimJ/RimL family protein N-acetyltransferase
MRYLAPGHEDFDRAYFAHAGPASIRAATWGDLARVSALYNRHTPDWLIKHHLPPRHVFRGVRYESHYISVWRPASQGRGVALVLENSRRRVVGIAGAVEVDSYHEQHVRMLDFWACPAYLEQAPALLAAVAERADAQGAEVLQAQVAACDQDKQRLLEAAGFEREARLRGRLRVDGQRVDLLVYSRILGRKETPAHPSESYYGAGHALHTVQEP